MIYAEKNRTFFYAEKTQVQEKIGRIIVRLL